MHPKYAPLIDTMVNQIALDNMLLFSTEPCQWNTVQAVTKTSNSHSNLENSIDPLLLKCHEANLLARRLPKAAIVPRTLLCGLTLAPMDCPPRTKISDTVKVSIMRVLQNYTLESIHDLDYMDINKSCKIGLTKRSPQEQKSFIQAMQDAFFRVVYGFSTGEDNPPPQRS